MPSVHLMESSIQQVLVQEESGVPCLGWRSDMQEGTQPHAPQLGEQLLCGKCGGDRCGATGVQ